MKSEITAWKTFAVLVLVALVSACAGIDKQPQVLDPRPAYHLVSIEGDGVRTFQSYDGRQWSEFLHRQLSAADCYDVALSADGAGRYLVYNHIDESGQASLNVLAGTDERHWRTSAASLKIPPLISCAQPQIRHLRGDLYGIMWLAEGRLYSAIYDAGERDGDKLYLSEPVQDNWFDLARITDLSFAYHNDAVYVVWSPNSKDRIMSMRGDINGHTISYGEPDYHLERHVSVSNMVSDGEFMYIAVVTGNRVNMLKHSDDGSYWSKGPACYNIDNLPILIPFLYVDAQGDKIYLKSYDYAGSVNYLQNFTDCERTEVNIPSEVMRIEYFPGL